MEYQICTCFYLSAVQSLASQAYFSSNSVTEWSVQTTMILVIMTNNYPQTEKSTPFSAKRRKCRCTRQKACKYALFVLSYERGNDPRSGFRYEWRYPLVNTCPDRAARNRYGCSAHRAVPTVRVHFQTIWPIGCNLPQSQFYRLKTPKNR